MCVLSVGRGILHGRREQVGEHMVLHKACVGCVGCGCTQPRLARGGSLVLASAILCVCLSLFSWPWACALLCCAQAVRTMLLLRGLCHSLQLDVSTAHMWRPLALRALAPSPLSAKPNTRPSFSTQRSVSENRQHSGRNELSVLSTHPQGPHAGDVIKHGSASTRPQHRRQLSVERPQHLSRSFQHR